MDFNETTTDDENRTRNRAGGISYDPVTPEMGLYKKVVNNLLEDTYYREDTEALEEVRVAFDRCADEDREFVLKLASYARNAMGNRDIAVLLYTLACNDDRYATSDPDDTLVRDYGPRILCRMDEPATALAINDMLFGQPAPKPLKKGIADAISNMLGGDYDTGAYRLGKYKQTSREVTIYDVVNRCHVRDYADIPDGSHKAELLTRLMEGDLDSSEVDPIQPPGTWENIISERGSTEGAWRDALTGDVSGVSRGMGIMARIRNIRNMLEAGLAGSDIFGPDELERVRQSRMFPFRFFTAYRAYQRAVAQGEIPQDTHVEAFLEDAIEATVENVPDDWQNTAVGIDLSGSMYSPLSSNSVVEYADLSAFFGAIMLQKGGYAVGFGRNMQPITAHIQSPVLETAESILHTGNVEIDQGGTNAWKFMEHLNRLDRDFDRVVFLTDMQAWDTNRFIGGRGFLSDEAEGEQTVKQWIDDYRQTHGDTAVYMIDLSSYGSLQTPEGYDQVFNISGWTSKVVEFIEYAEEPGQVIDEIREW